MADILEGLRRVLATDVQQDLLTAAIAILSATNAAEDVIVILMAAR